MTQFPGPNRLFRWCGIRMSVVRGTAPSFKRKLKTPSSDLILPMSIHPCALVLAQIFDRKRNLILGLDGVQKRKRKIMLRISFISCWFPLMDIRFSCETKAIPESNNSEETESLMPNEIIQLNTLLEYLWIACDGWGGHSEDVPERRSMNDKAWLNPSQSMCGCLAVCGVQIVSAGESNGSTLTAAGPNREKEEMYKWWIIKIMKFLQGNINFFRSHTSAFHSTHRHPAGPYLRKEANGNRNQDFDVRNFSSSFLIDDPKVRVHQNNSI